MAYQFVYTDRFVKHYRTLSSQEKDLLRKKLRLLAENPMHPSLRTKRIKGTERLFECSVNMDIRIIWYYEGNTIIILVDVGHHDILRKASQWKATILSMAAEQIAKSVAYCGLVCGLCQPDGGCDCRSANRCGKQLSPEGCFQHDCCIEKGFAGCWECPDFPCGKDMLKNMRIRTFVKCIREDGLEAFAGYILRNQEQGIVYHYEGTYSGDYELDSEEDILRLLRTGERGRAGEC